VSIILSSASISREEGIAILPPLAMEAARTILSSSTLSLNHMMRMTTRKILICRMHHLQTKIFLKKSRWEELFKKAYSMIINFNLQVLVGREIRTFRIPRIPKMNFWGRYSNRAKMMFDWIIAYWVGYSINIP
jgi:hypothetical protein